MKRRGRPPYPDVLTPRQWQVLALLREGLSNEQIARRLGISLDGVKFHVSEILGKLGVSNRNEAASWQRETPETASPSASLACAGGRGGVRSGAVTRAMRRRHMQSPRLMGCTRRTHRRSCNRAQTAT